MDTASPFTAAERWASMQAAGVGGLLAGVASAGLLLLHQPHLLPTLGAALSRGEWTSLALLSTAVSLAIAGLSGALFALTYRYAIRQDDNPQLKAGVVLAFSLVRGLAQVDAGSAIAQNFWPFLAACGESFLLFGGCAIALNLGFAQQWLKPFGPDA
jgi:hypothetical protein